jgi:putative intracellular protease/amidase
MTGFYTTQIDLENAGAVYDGKDEALVDGNLVTGQSYLSHVPMMKEFLKLLK